MRALLVVFGSFGLALGLLCAALAPYLITFGWFAYTPISGAGEYESTLDLSFDRSPTLAIMPAAGLVLGLILALVLHRARWRLRRG